jgi:hypothetical protein
VASCKAVSGCTDSILSQDWKFAATRAYGSFLKFRFEGSRQDRPPHLAPHRFPLVGRAVLPPASSANHDASTTRKTNLISMEIAA